MHYKNTNYFDDFYQQFRRLIDNSDEKLIDLNMKIIYFLKNFFDIDTEIVFASSLKLKEDKFDETKKGDLSEELLKICKALGAKTYLSGSGGNGSSYLLNSQLFEKNFINVKFQDFSHPIYPQRYPGFLPNMSSIDALFCIGKNSFPLLKVVNR